MIRAMNPPRAGLPWVVILKLLLLTLLVVTMAAPPENKGTANAPGRNEEWKEFKAQFKKNYGKGEAGNRRKIWEENTDFIEQHKEAEKKGKAKYHVKMNKFADLTMEEIFKEKTGFVKPVQEKKEKPNKGTKPNKRIPDSLDWRNHGYVTPVKNQQTCGSCYAFSAAAALEGQWFKYTDNLISLSEQNIVDCVELARGGCRGGMMGMAWNNIAIRHGINSEEDYPYESADGECRFNESNVAATCSEWFDIYDNETSLLEAVATIGPISVAIHATSRGFLFYSGGVFNEDDCALSVNHAVTVVGYGTDTVGGDYWIVKNSWGAGWGEAGYIWMARNQGNCLISKYAMYPVVP